MDNIPCLPLEEQAEVRSKSWLSAKQLEEAGIPCRKGAYTKTEKQNIHDAIQMYQKENNLDDEQLDDLIRSEEPTGGFWGYVARAVPLRTVRSVFYHVRRAHEPLGKAGKWSAAEDEQLRIAVETHGNEWSTVADILHRSPADCSDRFRQHIQFKDSKRRGAWSSEEEGQLLNALERLARDGKSDMSARGFWVSVSRAMDATRTPKQCQNKWSDSLEGKLRNEGKTRRWSENDSYILVCKIHSLDAEDESDIDWKSLNDPMWNIWGGHFLQQKWRHLKASCESDGTSCHRDVVFQLFTKICTPTHRAVPWERQLHAPQNGWRMDNYWV